MGQVGPISPSCCYGFDLEPKMANLQRKMANFATFWEAFWLPKRHLFDVLLRFRGRVLFVMVFDCYFVRLSFGFKDCRAARANGAYAGSSTKTNGLNGSGKKTHGTNILKIVFVGTFWSFFSFPPTQPQKSPQYDLPEPLRDPPGGPPGG